MNIESKIRELFSIVRELEAAYPGRKFTLDGHLVGSIGEVYAAENYKIELYPASVPIHDGELPDGRKIQIKATQGKSVGLRGCPEYLLVLKILANGSLEEVYFGDGQQAWEASGKMQKNGQRPISLSKLQNLSESK